MQTGTIVTVKIDKGYFFISPDGTGRTDIFCHKSALRGLTFAESLYRQRVHFDTEASERGPRAIEVRPID